MFNAYKKLNIIGGREVDMKKFKKIGLYLLLGLLILSLAGCKANDKDIDGSNNNPVEDQDELENNKNDEISQFPIEFQDDFGNKARIEKRPEKIISLIPSNTEILFALGLGDKIVGLTSNDDYPEQVSKKEIVGDYNGSNLERIVEMEADLVLVYREGNEDDVKILKEAGITVLGFGAESIDGVMKDIEDIGMITGKNKEAKKLVDSMKAKKNEIVEKVKDQDKVKVFYEIWHDPLQAAGKGSFMDEIMTLAGGENIASDAEGEYPKYDLEQLIERDPEVYLTSEDVADKTVESMKARPGFSEIKAIKNNRVYILDPNITSRPGPRIVEALELVAKAIHPEVFK